MGLRVVTDDASARWIVDRIHGFAEDVGSIVPPGFAAYGRLFHPAGRGVRDVRWSEVAAATGATVHAEMQWANVCGVADEFYSPIPAVWDRPPVVGSLPERLAPGLVRVLAEHTQTPRSVWFAIWDGWGAARYPAHAAVLDLPGRQYVLARGALENAAESVETPPFWQSASLWWPDDRAWCVASEIDFRWTYVGGSRRLIDQLLHHSILEVLETQTHHVITADGDHVNPRPEGTT